MLYSDRPIIFHFQKVNNFERKTSNGAAYVLANSCEKNVMGNVQSMVACGLTCFSWDCRSLGFLSFSNTRTQTPLTSFIFSLSLSLSPPLGSGSLVLLNLSGRHIRLPIHRKIQGMQELVSEQPTIIIDEAVEEGSDITDFTMDDIFE
ncbi:uncharacterized protein [Spinacia oleracea]|uniref:Uncharacterized protein n=1 Tax=Spinacia oleracea TaxID=3562 RepID=A0ABM3R7N7_SPIOL|nr:uncharacterized protein LOC110794180 [Spinacia oleracea]